TRHPHSPTEQQLAQIWQRVLNLDSIALDDNFFALGGDSILAIQAIAQANAIGLHLTPKQIFQAQTLAELAALANTIEAIAAPQGKVTGAVPLTPIQHWFFEQNLADAHHWNQSLLLEVRQAIDLKILARSIAHLIAHHDALRLRFHVSEAGWQQVHADSQICL
ncbi:MAG: hypothetical protein HC895_25760, partial [Leptolyngbyaceae cyanobacterium SM1_3_5]|nr:hypothetical protein [Leptolyngbyaceae cyanobacterium SM1_3_5]